MKCLITGHTSGIGKEIYNRFTTLGYEVTGISRQNGYNVGDRYNDILELAKNCDVFVNNVYLGDSQIKFLIDLEGHVPNIISIGSLAGYYVDNAIYKHEYCLNKKNLTNITRKLSLTSTSNLLVINVGLTENASTSPGCTYKDITDVCEFWLDNPKFNVLDFNIKLNDTNEKLVEQDFGIKRKDIT